MLTAIVIFGRGKGRGSRKVKGAGLERRGPSRSNHLLSKGFREGG